MTTLLTIDIQEGNGDRTLFYEELERMGFDKVKGVTTAWKHNDAGQLLLEMAQRQIERALQIAKEVSGVTGVSFAFQIGRTGIGTGKV